MPKGKAQNPRQYAAIPFTVGADGRVRVLLLTSRETRRWVVPKGWPIKGLKPREVAAREAFEEAGLRGRIIGRRRGTYHYSKRLADGTDVLCRVDVFLLWVESQAETWPEQAQRETCWVEPEAAAGMVLEGGLAELIREAVPGRMPQHRRQ